MEATIPTPPQAMASGAVATAAKTRLPTHARTLWRSRLGSGLRAALACAIVAFTSVYSPPVVRRRLAFPAFSYVSAILISGEATLGDTLQGVACALYGSVLGVLPAVLSMFLIGPTGLSIGVRTLAVVLSSLVVALPESTPLLAKRVALGQIILIYVAPLTSTGGRGAVWQPVHVAASTALGVVASLLALLLPYPRLACHEVSKKSRLFTHVALEKLGLFVHAFCADNKASAVASISKAKWLSESGDKLLHSIKMKQAGRQWEKPQLKLSLAPVRAPSERLRAIDRPLKGMELALTSIPSFPINIVDRELRDLLLELDNHITQTLKLDKHAAGKETGSTHGTLQPFRVSPPVCSEDLPPLFFLFCMQLLRDESTSAHHSEHLSEKRVAPTANASDKPSQQEPSNTTKKIWSIRSLRLSGLMLMAALKCSLSMGLAVYLGLLFSKDNGYWSGLAVAIVMTPWREATFKLANARAHGTALGTVYGVLGALISRDLMGLRVLVLLPWVVFTSFLRRSRMYGHAGGISAALAAIMILGRRYGSSSDAFAITRLTETCIGLCCSILVELLLQPTRASSLARTNLSQSIRALHDCVRSVDSTELREKGKLMSGRVDQLKKSIGEADGEPNFWFTPFSSSCYNKLQNSLRRMVELVLFMGHGFELLKRELSACGVDWNEVQEPIKGEVESFKKVVSSLLQCFEDVTRVKIVQEGIQMDGLRQTSTGDLEMGEQPRPCSHCVMFADEEDSDKITASFLHHAKEVLEKVHRIKAGDEEDSKSQIVLCMATVGFCMGGLLREAQEIRKCALELVQRENPPNHLDLYEISSKGKTSVV